MVARETLKNDLISFQLQVNTPGISFDFNTTVPIVVGSIPLFASINPPSNLTNTLTYGSMDHPGHVNEAYAAPPVGDVPAAVDYTSLGKKTVYV